MTIARKLILLLAFPLLVMAALGVFGVISLGRIEERTRAAAIIQSQSLAAAGQQLAGPG